MSHSSREAEYCEIANTTAELTWLSALLIELGIFESHSPTLQCDTIGATILTVNLVFHARTKHIEIDLHFVRDKVASRQLSVQFISSKATCCYPVCYVMLHTQHSSAFVPCR